jgi:hypothetical protein
MLSIKKELKIYRGTYEEINAQTTEDMAIYFAWDTQEIYVGNKFGVKTPYIGGNRLSERELRDFFISLTTEELELLKSQILSINISATSALSAATEATTRLDDLENDIRDDIIEKINALTAPGGTLNDVIYTRTETDAKIAEVVLNYYTKAESDSKLPDVGTGTTFAADYIALKDTVASLQDADSTFDSIKVLDENVITENQLLAYATSVEIGLYTFRTSAGYEILNKSEDSVVRISTDGNTRLLTDSDWLLILDQTSIRSINGLTTSDGSILLNFNDISGSEGKVFNSLLPQENNVINPLGRNTALSIGENSIAFGYNSAAQGVSSIAIGSQAVTTGVDSIQLGTSSGNNTEDRSFKVWEHKLLDKTTGKIPTERITERFNSVVKVITSASWNVGKEVQVSVPDVTANSIIWISPAENSYSDFSKYAVRGLTQSANIITFKCDEIPTVAISVNIVWRD